MIFVVSVVRLVFTMVSFVIDRSSIGESNSRRCFDSFEAASSSQVNNLEEFVDLVVLDDDGGVVVESDFVRCEVFSSSID